MTSEIHINKASFGQLSSQANELVIEISPVSIDFIEFYSEETKPLFICHYPIDENLVLSIQEHFVNAVKHFEFAKKKYINVFINFFTTQFTLCPSIFYNEDNVRTLLEFNVGSTNDKIILTDDVNHDIKLIYAIDENLKSILDNLFPNHKLKHTQTILAKLMLQSDELLKDDVLLSINDGYIEIIIKKDQKLFLANQFSIKTQEDVLYYLLFTLEQFQLQPTTTNIRVIGNIDSTSKLITTLKKYIKTITLGKGHKSINWESIVGMPQHFNYTLLNRLFCE